MEGEGNDFNTDNTCLTSFFYSFNNDNDHIVKFLLICFTKYRLYKVYNAAKVRDIFTLLLRLDVSYLSMVSKKIKVTIKRNNKSTDDSSNYQNFEHCLSY